MVLRLLPLLFFVAGMAFFLMFLYSFVRQRNGVVAMFSFICLSLCVYNVGTALELMAKDLEQAKFFITIEYLGISFLPAFFAMLAYKHYYNKSIAAGSATFFLLMPLVTVFLNATNDYHNLYYADLTMRNLYGYTSIEVVRGPWYYVFYFYAYLCLVAGAYVFFLCWKKEKFTLKAQCFWLFLSPLSPIVAGILYYANIVPHKIDILPYSFLPLVPIFFIMLFKYDFLEIKNYISSYVFGQIKEGILIIDENNKIADFNKAAELTFDWLENVNKNKSILEFEDGRKIVANGKDTFEISIGKNGNSKVYEFRASALAERGKSAGKLFLFQDVTEQKMAIERLNYMATYDMLCDIYNRNKLYEEIDMALSEMRKSGGHLSLFMIDIDFFKQINDTYGHLSGDMVIKKVAKALKKIVGSSAIVGRYGGEEFVVVMPGADEKTAFDFAEKIRNHVENIEFNIKNDIIKLTISIGVSTVYSEATTSLQYLINEADKALYTAKNSGRNKTVVFK